MNGRHESGDFIMWPNGYKPRHAESEEPAVPAGTDTETEQEK